MEDRERIEQERLVLAPYLQKATALIGRGRRVGGSQFRHAMATLAILIDYHVTDAVLLKASVIHDLFEEIPETDPDGIRAIDEDGARVVELVLKCALSPMRRFQTRVPDGPDRRGPEADGRLRTAVVGRALSSFDQGGQNGQGNRDRSRSVPELRVRSLGESSDIASSGTFSA